MSFTANGTGDPFTYARAALDSECAILASTGRGRNDQVNRSGFACGQFIPGGFLSRGEVEHRLMGAAEASGIVGKDGRSAVAASLRSGIEGGMRQPRDIPSGSGSFKDDIHVQRPRPKLSGVELPAWTEPGEDGKPKFGSIGRDQPFRFDDEARRHLYMRDGVVVRVKVKSAAGRFVDWYLVRRSSDKAVGWQAKKPEGWVPVPYLSPGRSDPFAPERRGDVLVWAEGEKDCDALHAHGFAAFTFGSASDVPDVSGLLDGHHVIVVVDNDDAGRKSIARKVGAAIEAGAASVKLVRFHDLPEGGDCADFFEAGGDAEAFLDRAERVDPATWRAEAEDSADRHQGPSGGKASTGKGAKASRSAKAPPPREPNDTRPVITLRAGAIKEAVDAAEAALMARGGLYQRANAIVFVGEAPVRTSDDREVLAVRVFERGEHALAEDIAEAACVMKFDARANDDVVTNPPAWLIHTLMDRIGRFRFPVLTAVINAPTLRPDGSLLDLPGYDTTTGLFFDPRGVAFPPIATRPSRRDAERALADLSDLVGGFPFVDETDRSVALSGILTACVRQAMGTAPLHAYSAPTAGSGKGKLVDIPSVIATGREAGVIAQASSEEEMEKRLGAQFLEGAGAVAIDNCTHPIDGVFLCAALTQATMNIRPLGTSKTVRVPTNAFLTATGNNLMVSGDMTRRTLVCRLDAGVERPELREFDFEPVERAKVERVRYVTAALTILLAYQAAGAPPQAVPLGSFEGWSRFVRDALLWLGCADPVATMEQARTTDPKLAELTELLAQWRAVIGRERITVRKLIDKASLQGGPSGFDRDSREWTYPDLREALLAVAGQGGAINGRKLGKWLMAHAKRVVGGCWVEQAGIREGLMTWALVEKMWPRSASSGAEEPYAGGLL